VTGIGPSPTNTTDEQPFAAGVYTRVARVVSYLFISSALIVVTVAGEPSRQPLLYIVLAMGALLIVLGQDLLPMAMLGRWRPAVEAGTVLGFLTVLVMLTGGYASPFFLGYLLLLAGTSLWAQGVGPYVLALAAVGTYLVGVVLSPDGLPAPAWGQVGFNVVALALTSYVASVIGREQRRAHEAALRLSRFDALTELHSRSYFGFAFEQEILRSARSGRPFSLLMFDLDGLKPVNDRFGHASGDRLLRGVADVIRGVIRVTDVAARYGGDEFIVILPETDANGALRVAEKLRRDIAQLTLPENGQLIQSTVSVGLVSYPEDGRSGSELLRRADAAMYEAKRRGRDRTVRYQHLGDKRAVPMAEPSRAPDEPAPWDLPPADSAASPAHGAVPNIALPGVPVAAPPVEPPPASGRATSQG
jgi:diguanylate cyclase (GGDEF)-like protein